MPSEDHDEVERKYDVDLDAVVPELTSVAGITGQAEAREFVQVATYFDTADLRLLAAGITLRRRVGGLDDGWHLKLPVGPDHRVEVRVPAADDDGTVPTELLTRVRGDVRSRELSPVAVLTTRRVLHLLVDVDGVDLAELCDDHVTAETTSDTTGVVRWREWELELVDGSPTLLDEAEPVLLEAGALPSTSASKVARVLSERLPALPVWRQRRAPGKRPSAADVLTDYLAQHLLRLEEQDRRLRSGEQEGVHQLRVAARRMRSALSTYAPVLEPEITDRLRQELRWLGGALAEARDAQVQQARLHATLSDQPEELVVGQAAQHVDDELGDRFRNGRRHADAALAGDRYFRLRDDLEAFLSAPPTTETADEPARRVVPRLLAADLDRVRKRHRRHEKANDATARDAALHEVRKAAKRLRYAAESARPVFGARATRLAERAEALQELLGEHQDSFVARQLLVDLARRAENAGDSSFTFGRLHALEEQRAEELRHGYPKVLSKLPSKKLRRWLRD